MCKKCDENPKAHSFYKLAIEDGKSIFLFLSGSSRRL